MRFIFTFFLLAIYFTSTAQVPSYVPTSGLVGYWPFNGNANDESGNGNNGVVNGATLTTDRFGNVGKAYGFGDNFIQVPNSAILSNMNSISISAWVNIQNWHYFSGVGYFPIVHKSDQQFQYGKWAMGIRDVGPYCHLDNQETGFGFTSWNIYQWYQITTVISSDTSKLYINGQLIYSIRSGVFPQIPNQNLPLTIGMDRPGLVDYARGKIDDIAIYNRALTQQEVTALYTGNPPCTSTSSTTSLNIPSNQLPYTWNGLTFNNADTQTATLTNAAGCDSLATLNLTVTNQTPAYLPTNGLVGWWPFSGNANDESGNGNNGVVNGATLTTDRFGNVGKAYGFDGDNDFVEVIHSASLTFSSGVTISSWFSIPDSSLNTIGTASRQPIGKQVSPTVSGIGIETTDGIGTRFTPQFYIQGGAQFEDTNPSTINNWFHLVGTYDGSILKLYKNGVFIGSNTGTFNLTTITQNLFFGKQGALGGYYKGKLDDIAIYNRALTQQEITQLYTGTVVPTTTEDTTSNVGIGTLTPKRKLHVNDVMRLEPRDTAPPNPAKGDIYFDGVLNKLRVYDGTVWQNCW